MHGPPKSHGSLQTASIHNLTHPHIHSLSFLALSRTHAHKHTNTHTYHTYIHAHTLSFSLSLSLSLPPSLSLSLSFSISLSPPLSWWLFFFDQRCTSDSIRYCPKQLSESYIVKIRDVVKTWLLPHDLPEKRGKLETYHFANMDRPNRPSWRELRLHRLIKMSTKNTTYFNNFDVVGWEQAWILQQHHQ